MNKKQANLIRGYRKLGATIQEIVQVAAVTNAPKSRTNLVDMAAAYGVTDDLGSVPNYKNMRDGLNQAIELGVLSFKSKAKTGPVEIAGSLVDYTFRQAFDSGLAQKVLAEIEKGKSRYSSSYKDSLTVVRDMRMMFYSGDVKGWNEHLARYEIKPIVLSPFCIETYQRLKPELQAEYFSESAHQVLALASPNLQGFTDHIDLILNSTDRLSERSMVAAIDWFAARGDIEGLKKLENRVGEKRSEIAGCTAFLQGNDALALTHFEDAVKECRKRTKTRSGEIRHLPSLFYGILLLKANNPVAQKRLATLSKAISKWENAYWTGSVLLNETLGHQLNPAFNKTQQSFHADEIPPIAWWMSGLFWSWYFPDEKPPFQVKPFLGIAGQYRDAGVDWLAAEMNAIVARASSVETQSAKNQSDAEQIHERLGTVSIVDSVQPAAQWEVALTAIENLCSSGIPSSNASTSSGQVNDERMIWEIEYSERDSSWIHLTPFIQKLGKKGWSKGRKVGLGRLYEQWETSTFDFLTEQDRAICRCLKQRSEINYYGYRETIYDWNAKRLGQAVLGHPSIFRTGDRDQSVEITEIKPHLAIERTNKTIKLTVHPQAVGEGRLIRKDGSHRISIVEFSPEQRKVAALIADMPTIPANQLDRVAQLSQSVSTIIGVQSELEGTASTGETVESVSDIIVQLTPFQEGLRAELFVQPLGEKGPFCRPGIGAASMFSTVEGKSLATTRDLKTEQENRRQMLTSCRALDSRTVDNGQTEWIFPESEDALELVVELQELAQEEKVTVLWPRGKTHEIAGSASSKGFQVSVRRDRDWFAASGKLKVNDELTLDMMKLVDLVAASPTRFLQLDDGRFLELTQELRQKISDMAAFGTATKDKFRIPPIRVLHVDEVLQETKLKSDKYWKQYLTRIEEAASLDSRPPATLQADLRDYQTDGYAWLKRLTHWNSGACLADDMGLGKTIQALALLIDRAAKGPALVVAPASVGFNWESEAQKFAPSLTPKLFRNFDRTTFFDELRPGDLAITSYGLLQSESEEFSKVQWATVLLDEAQAIKNMETKRSQSVMQLQADFKLILTGTPLENHLGELWNLIRFITPGLLGSKEDFRTRFAIPIERDQCRQSRNRLRRLIQPFLLRRTKSEVLSELPSRTETVLEVEMSPAEVALYEALRSKAIEKIESAASDDSKRGQRHLQVLAELTRLRLACCHPSLVGGEEIESSKLALFRHQVQEIVEGKHKVLVFSQFVKHLSILRDELDSLGITYQYLDGSTPAGKRKAIVESFQAGAGDVFLISLKAGGTGLNLTAADYVIHMDPWWNPAVEDQATDRAHRIGQTRPVNVYRLVTKGTIEEKIVELHKTKRDLADSLLAGTDTAAKLTTEDLINLLRDESSAPC